MTRVSERAAAAVFAAAIAVAVPVILWTNRQQWFFLDEWDFLSARNGGSVSDLMRPHNEHWSLIPIVLYRVLYRLVGLHHYWPYQLLAVTAHLAAAVLLRAIMRRMTVDPWIATAACVLFVFFGTGRQDIGWGFQVGFTGSLAFGLAAIYLADRDLPAIACGLASLMCSGIGITMVVALGVTVLIARGWKPALRIAAPLAAVFVAWYGLEGVRQQSAEANNAHQVIELGWNTLRATIVGLGYFAGVGLVLVVAAAVGLRPSKRYAPAFGLLAGLVWFLVSTSYGRAGLSTDPAGRYLHLSAAMLLPAIAVGLSNLPSLAIPAVVAALLIGVPGNIRLLTPHGSERFLLG